MAAGEGTRNQRRFNQFADLQSSADFHICRDLTTEPKEEGVLAELETSGGIKQPLPVLRVVLNRSTSVFLPCNDMAL